MERTLVAFTTLLLSVGPAQATRLHTAQELLPARVSLTAASQRAQTKTIYLVRDGAVLWPGAQNDATAGISSIVSQPTAIGAWDIDDATWADTVACVKDIYQPFDVTITDEDPGDVPHLEAIFGGHPSDVGLPDNVAGVSPFTDDCAVIEGSVVFTFTDVLPDDARTMCEVMAQEIAHSYGLDHEMLSADPMTYLDHDGPRAFQNVDAPCGEFENRTCGIGTQMCRRTQNSVQLLGERLGMKNGGAPPAPGTMPPQMPGDDAGSSSGGCSAGRSRSSLLLALLALVLVRKPRSRA